MKRSSINTPEYMKTKKKLFVYIFAVFFSMQACVTEGDSLLDKQESGDLNEEKVFSDAENARKFLSNIYFEVPHGFDQQYWMDGISDDGEHRPLNSWSKNVYLGAYGPTSIPDELQRWQSCYASIRACNKFMEKIDEVPLNTEKYIATEEIRTRLKYEARLLRAMFYAELLRWYGGVPIITEVLDVNSPELYSPRANLQEMKDFIFAECDIAASKLPARYELSTDYGRVTSAVAEALKARVLLQFASPLFNSNNDAYGSTTSLCPWSWGDYKMERWKEAADAAMDFIRNKEGIYELWVSNGSRLTSTELNRITTLATRASYGFNEVSIVTPDGGNREIIHVYGRKGGATNEVTKFCVPHTMQSEKTKSGGTLPTMNFVGAFSTLNGIQIYETDEEGSYKTDANGDFIVTDRAKADGFDPQNPYLNRDNRFYHSVYYNGVRYSSGVVYEIWRSPTDGTFGQEYNQDFNHTGFFLRKHNDPFKVYSNNRTSTISGTTLNAFPLFRLTEVYLNFAEAQNEYLSDGADRSEIIRYLDLIRARADMPNVATTFSWNGWNLNNQKDMRNFIRNERRIELSFEIHRVHDVRRWKIGETTQRLIYRQEIIRNKTTNPPTDTYSIELSSRRAFEPKHYLQPIPYSEVANNPNMIQNPGW
ncbi:MAG: RagB/SusD family nutrient uptake outer membrane protein [Dysgonamonadaceae bacterium]|jgi:hypothetical protein|nr:RagB/SusD family nutrient uptake outer membrane protein [Dysgonamonadaceae bacterium]